MVSDFNDFTEVFNLQSLFPIKVTTVNQITYFQRTNWAMVPCGIFGDHVCEFSVSFSSSDVHRFIDGGQMGSDPATMEQLTW